MTENRNSLLAFMISSFLFIFAMFTIIRFSTSYAVRNDIKNVNAMKPLGGLYSKTELADSPAVRKKVNLIEEAIRRRVLNDILAHKSDERKEATPRQKKSSALQHHSSNSRPSGH